MGGADDPRIGTKTSTADPDFMLRNFVWLLSTNTLYVVDIREPSFSDVDVASPTPRAATPRAATPSTPRDVSRSPRPSPASLLMNEEFATVDVRFFCGHVLFDINFFTAPAGDNPFCRPAGRLAIFFGGRASTARPATACGSARSAKNGRGRYGAAAAVRNLLSAKHRRLATSR